VSILFPRPFAIAIDDLGWINGHDEGEGGYGPFRLGMDRMMTMADYDAVINLAKRAGVRLQGLFILSEMDRENFLGQYPTTTHMRGKWDNSQNISDLQVEMMEYVKSQSAHLEFGLHGVGHEFWPEDGKRKRAEWYNTDDHLPWPEDDIRNHVECFIQLMKQYGISREYGHSFPESFVPCAYSYHWDPTGPYSSGSILSDYGVRYANTDFSQILESNPPLEAGGGYDHLVHVMNRYNYGNLWFEIGKTPTTPLEKQETDYIETHWPNLLGHDADDHIRVTDMWVDYYQKVQQNPERYCAKNTAQMHAQWLYNRHTIVRETEPGIVEIDNRAMPSSIYRGLFPGNMVLKVALNKGEHISKATLDGKTIPAYYEDQGYGFIYLPQLLRKRYTLTYTIGKDLIKETIWHDNTSNILEITVEEGQVKIDIILYGKQSIRYISDIEPKHITSNNPGIRINEWSIQDNMLSIEAEAHDMQGEIGSIRIVY
jgi:hypothetical protein